MIEITYKDKKINTEEKTVYELFKNNVIQNPNKLAISYQDKKLTYQELNNLANLIADKLQNTIILKSILERKIIQQNLS